MAKYNKGDILESFWNPSYYYKVVKVLRGGRLEIIPVERDSFEETGEPHTMEYSHVKRVIFSKSL